MYLFVPKHTFTSHCSFKIWRDKLAYRPKIVIMVPTTTKYVCEKLFLQSHNRPKIGNGVILNWCKSWNTVSNSLITSLMSTKTLNLENLYYTQVFITLNTLHYIL